MSRIIKVGRGFITPLKRDWLALLLYFLSTILMTYPIAFKLGTNWLAFHDSDTFVKLWDNWWITTRVAGDPPYFTNKLFYPNGLDLSYHSISWTAAWMARLFETVVNPITAYNLTILMAILGTGYGAYLLILYLIDDRRLAWFGGAIYTFAPYHLTHTGGHPDLTHLAAIPLAALFLIDAFRRRRWQTAVLAAFFIMVSAYTSLYIMIFTVLTVGPLLLFLLLLERRWQYKQVWIVTAVFGLCTILFLTFRLLPIFQNPTGLSQAIEQKFLADAGQTDLASFITPSHFNPLFDNWIGQRAERFNMNKRWPAYLGMVPLLLTIIAMTWRKELKRVWPWLTIGLIFFVLALGPVLRVNGKIIEQFLLPSSYINWFPPIRAVGRPDFFVLGLLLPLAVCAAYGLKRCLHWFSSTPNVQTAVIVVASLLVLFEYWNGVYPGIELPVSPFYAQLSEQPEEVAIIDLPMGRFPSKLYVYYQTIHQKPIVEGLSARTLPESYTYIRNNLLLEQWSRQIPLDCQLLPSDMIRDAVSQLQEDGFQYILVHNDADGRFPFGFAEYFPIPHHYQDDLLTVYKISDLKASGLCSSVNGSK